MILNPITLAPDAHAARSDRADAALPISGVPIVDGDGRLVGIITNRDLQFERNLDRPLARGDDAASKLVTAPVGTTLDEAERILAQAPHREAAGGRRRRRAQGPHHGQGHPQAPRSIPNANKDQHGRLRVAAAIGAARRLPRPRARRWSTPASTCSSSTRRTATARACSTRRRRVREAFPDVQLIAGNVATRDGARGARRARRRRGEGRRRPGLDLHDARRHRRRRSAAHRGVRCGRGRGRRSGHRRRRHQVLGRRREGARRRRVERDDGLDARRHRGEPGRDRSCSRAAASR